MWFKRGPNYKALYEAERASGIIKQAEADAWRVRYEKAYPEMQQLKNAATSSDRSWRELVAKLSSLLTKEQKEAANICRCQEYVYAINLIRLCNQKIDELKRFS